MHAAVQRSVLALVVLACTLPACAGRLEDVVRGQAAGDLSCPESQVTVRGGSRGGLHDFAASGCGRERSYEAACNSLGTCVAFPVRDRDGAGAPEREALWADPPVVQPEAGAISPSASRGVPEPELTPEPAVAPVVRSAEASGEPRAVTLRNECERTVALFIGEDPAAGAGRYTSLGSTNTATLRLRPGEPVWLLDAKGAGLTSIALDGDVDEIVVLEGCGGFVAR